MWLNAGSNAQEGIDGAASLGSECVDEKLGWAAAAIMRWYANQSSADVFGGCVGIVEGIEGV